MRVPPALRFVSPIELAERLEAGRHGVSLTLYRDGDGRQRIVRLDGGPLCIGRGPSSDLPLEWDSEVSRVHAMLERGVGMEPD